MELSNDHGALVIEPTSRFRIMLTEQPVRHGAHEGSLAVHLSTRSAWLSPRRHWPIGSVATKAEHRGLG
jgi:hypothetical protein